METNTQPPVGQSQPTKSFFEQMDQFFRTYLHDKAPFHLPPGAKEFIVKFGPWITLIAMIISLPFILLAFGLGAMVTPFAMMAGNYGFGIGMTIGGIITLIALILQGAALPGLFARSHKGWHLVYYSVLVSAVAQLIRFDIIGLIVSLAISLFILFEIESYYK